MKMFPFTDKYSRMPILNYILALFLGLNWTGCASSGKVVSASQASLSKPGPAVNLVVVTTSSIPKSGEQVNLIEALTISGLSDSHKFTHVASTANSKISNGDTKVLLEIASLNKVSDDSRAWFGALAGQARILVKVTISDLVDGHQIQYFEVEGKSSAGFGWAGTTDQAIQKLVDQVVASILKLY
ncbi:MAG: hypothetical protein WCS94_20050 [Verrucomicrobiota bacterium]